MPKHSLAVRAHALRSRYQQSAQNFERGASIGVASFLIGIAEKKGVLPVTVAGVPAKPVLSLVAYLISANATGSTKRVAHAIGDSALAVYAYDAARAGSLIAGDE